MLAIRGRIEKTLGMRGSSDPQLAMLTSVSAEDLIPADHPIRKIRVVVDAVRVTAAELAAIGGATQTDVAELLGTRAGLLFPRARPAGRARSVDTGGPRSRVDRVRRLNTRPLPHRDLFWSHVDRTTTPDGCWPWTGATDKNGYGVLMHRGSTGEPSRRLGARARPSTERHPPPPRV